MLDEEVEEKQTESRSEQDVSATYPCVHFCWSDFRERDSGGGSVK